MSKRLGGFTLEDWDSIFGMANLALEPYLEVKREDHNMVVAEWDDDGMPEWVESYPVARMVYVLDNLHKYEAGRSHDALKLLADGGDLGQLDVVDAANWVQLAVFGEVIFG